MGGATAALDNSILLIGDNRFLLRLVGANLAPLAVDAVLLGHEDDTALPGYAASGAPACKLVLLALSSSSNEPVVVLAQAGLTRLVGAIPLLIISDRPFAADPARNIFHLPFPFRADTLQKTVGDLLARAAIPEDGQASIDSQNSRSVHLHLLT